MDLTQVKTAPESNILVVEDDPFWQRVLQRNIEKAAQNSHISYATSAEEALAMLEMDDHFNLVVADQYLEGQKTGYELWWDCKHRGIFVPFLLTSANVDFQDIEHLPVHFVAKPFVAAELRHTLADLLSVPSSVPALKNFLSTKEMRWTLMFAAAVVTVAVYLDTGPLIVPAPPVSPSKTLTTPPPIKTYQPGGKVVKIMGERDSPLFYEREKIFTPRLISQIERIVERADEILSLNYMIRQESRLRILSEPFTTPEEADWQWRKYGNL